MTLEDSITPLNKGLMNVETEGEPPAESFENPETQVKIPEDDKDIGGKDLPESAYPTQIDDESVSVDIQKEFNSNIERYKTINGKWNCTVLSEEIYSKDELITEEGRFKYEYYLEKEADILHLDFINAIEKLKEELKKKNEDKEKENEVFEKEKNKAIELTEESEKTAEELRNLINQADNNLIIPESEKEILTAYSEMKTYISAYFEGQTEAKEVTPMDVKIKNMITILLNEVICRDVSGLDTITNLFKASKHENWIPTARKQAVCFMVEDGGTVITPKICPETIIDAYKKEFNYSLTVDENNLNEAINKADLLSRYAVAGEDDPPKRWTYEDLEGLQNSSKSTQANENINNAPKDNTIKDEANFSAKMSQDVTKISLSKPIEGNSMVIDENNDIKNSGLTDEDASDTFHTSTHSSHHNMTDLPPPPPPPQKHYEPTKTTGDNQDTKNIQAMPIHQHLEITNSGVSKKTKRVRTSSLENIPKSKNDIISAQPPKPTGHRNDDSFITKIFRSFGWKR
ncbi:hypothetical protein INT47_000066 [Mucor saturninus]|uniref:Uncharacterized protein n=1 Tax=Mucor saturninus TaxID=64648 RepID=A0A8H7RII9_9FUNG|nr:hypothetical protein INT47_000066 [Mucor saturninus]